MIKILHIITSTNVGGAEMMLKRVVIGSDNEKIQAHVISLLPKGEVGEMIEEQGVPVDSLNLSRGRISLSGIFRAGSIIKEFQPDIVMTWLYHADLLGAIMKFTGRKWKLVWNLRCANMDLKDSRLTRMVRFTCACFSLIPDAVIANSRAGLLLHQNIGYKSDDTRIIANGFDTSIFKPDKEAREKIRSAWNLSDDNMAIGMAARFDPMKGHNLFCKACGIIAGKNKNARFVFCGQGCDRKNSQLMAWIKKNKIENKSVLAGKMDNMAEVYPGFDIFCLPSRGEGFPNVVGEAMASSLVPVVTDVGDAAFVVGEIAFAAGELSLIVPPENPSAMASALLQLLSMDKSSRQALGSMARDRIKEKFSLENVLSEYEKLYGDLLNIQI